MARNSLPTFFGQLFWDWDTELAKRTIPGYRIFEQHGWHENLKVVDGLMLLGDDGEEIAYPSTPEQLTIVSDSAQDDKDNTTTNGASSVSIGGTDGSQNLVNENIDLEGLTGVTTVNEYADIHFMRAFTREGALINEGTITATHSEGLLNKIPAGRGREGIALYSFYSPYRWIPKSLTVSVSNNCSIIFQSQNTSSGTWTTENTFGVSSDTEQLDIFQWIGILPAKRRFRILVKNEGVFATDIRTHMQFLRIDLDVKF